MNRCGILILRMFIYSSESLKFHLQEEEHLLESPYQTNCTDYEDLWNKNNKTGPRSQEMCKEWCLWNYHKSCEDCETTLTMVEKPIKMCFTNGRSFHFLHEKSLLMLYHALRAVKSHI
ncbi:hypothetical protein NPIL_7661 [Nephila pilipes]|uniref:Uncharacterized protein n=1 Tax=Nephila pilipes TaxID=299642 RepID=A0A8X6PHZ4_NEPPI|nr:hypothetical protein NPIL_7661 [Nephila pilipes]